MCYTTIYQFDMFAATAKQSLISLLLLASVYASPSPVCPAQDMQTLVKRGTLLTTKLASETVRIRNFVLENNLWGQSAADSSSWQTSRAIGVDGDSVAWTTSYSWSGSPNTVKSFANLDLKAGLSNSLKSISSIPTSWQWSYAAVGPNLRADVAYDIWLSNVAGSTGASSSSTYEVMIWLSARGGASPAGSQVAKAKFHGVQWTLYKGTVKTWTIFSFVPAREITDFTSDLLPFFTYLRSKQGVPSSQLLVQFQAGAEPFSGTATLATSSFSAAINT